jgi:hypothetical protein
MAGEAKKQRCNFPIEGIAAEDDVTQFIAPWPL